MLQSRTFASCPNLFQGVFFSTFFFPASSRESKNVSFFFLSLPSFPSPDMWESWMKDRPSNKHLDFFLFLVPPPSSSSLTDTHTWKLGDHLNFDIKKKKKELVMFLCVACVPAGTPWGWPPPCCPPCTPAARRWTRAGGPWGSWRRRCRRARRTRRRRTGRGRSPGTRRPCTWKWGA